MVDKVTLIQYEKELRQTIIKKCENLSNTETLIIMSVLTWYYYCSRFRGTI